MQRCDTVLQTYCVHERLESKVFIQANSAVTSFTTYCRMQHFLRRGSLCDFAVGKLLKHGSSVTGFVESELLWCGPQWCWHKEMAQRTAQTQTNTRRHPHSCGNTSDMKLSIHKHVERQRQREREREEGRRGNAGERDMEGHCLWGSVHLFAVQSFHAIFFYISPPIVIKHVLGQHIGLVNYPI